MKTWFDRLLLTALLAVVVALTATAVPALSGEHLGGRMLFAHMGASGALVVILPLFAINGLSKYLNHAASSARERLSFWTVVLTGLITVTTVFVCMLPVATTDQMEVLIQWHGYAGFALIIAVIVLCSGIWSVASKAKAAAKVE